MSFSHKFTYELKWILDIFSMNFNQKLLPHIFQTKYTFSKKSSLQIIKSLSKYVPNVFSMNFRRKKCVRKNLLQIIKFGLHSSQIFFLQFSNDIQTIQKSCFQIINCVLKCVPNILR